MNIPMPTFEVRYYINERKVSTIKIATINPYITQDQAEEEAAKRGISYTHWEQTQIDDGRDN